MSKVVDDNANNLIEYDFASLSELKKHNIKKSDAVRTKIIKDHILLEGDKLREKYTWLLYQDTVGLLIFLICSAAIITTWYEYINGNMSVWFVIPIAAFFMSILHELEHDLIHLMYFRKNKFINSLLLWGVWIFRPSTINPFVRRRLHIHHHKSSGTETDLEEKGITNGEHWGLKRLLMTGDNMLAFYLRPIETIKTIKLFVKAQKNLDAQERKKVFYENIHGYFPLGVINYTIWHWFIIYYIVYGVASSLGYQWSLPEWANTTLHFMTIWVVCIAAPNALRTFCLHFVSSNIHYYGDVENGNVIQQCQIWRSAWILPLHLFCFNFGGTHAIHHFVVRDPFYIRQAIAKQCYPIMKENGVRFNDFGTFFRANRRGNMSLT